MAKQNENQIDFSSKEIMESINEDKEIENQSYLQYYHSLLTENLRSNNRQITSNSYVLILSAALYFLIFMDIVRESEIPILSLKITDKRLLLNFIPVVFSFIFLRNVTIWNNNLNLLPKFENTSKKVFNFGLFSDSINVIKPFSFLHHIINYQYNKKNLKRYYKLLLTMLFLLFLLFPIFFNLFSVYIIAIKNTHSFIDYFCGIIVMVFTIITIVQALNAYK